MINIRVFLGFGITIIILVIFLFILTNLGLAQGKLTEAEISEAKQLIQKMKQNPRGPYRSIHWFAEDGSVHPPREKPGPEHGKAYQHAAFSNDAKRLKQLGFSVGIILASLSYDEFFDSTNRRDPHETLKQYLLCKFLYEADDGWVLRKAQTYRGAVQIEDEEFFGRQFMTQMLSHPKWVRRNFLLAREAVRLVPHRSAERDDTRTIRQLSKEISDQDSSFQSIRVKIHSWPDEDDIKAVELYIEKNPQTAPSLRKKLDLLLESLKTLYGEIADPKHLETFAQRFKGTPHESRLRKLRTDLATKSTKSIPNPTKELSAYLAQLRTELEASSDGKRNLSLMDLSIYLERLLLFQVMLDSSNKEVQAGGRRSHKDLLARYWDLVEGAYGSGLLSDREKRALWSDLEPALSLQNLTSIRYKELSDYLRRVVEWSYGTTTFHFGSIVERYALIEPLAVEFIPNLMRSSLLLPLSEVVDQIASDSAVAIGLTNDIFNQKQSGKVRALNPGLAFGVLDIFSEKDIHTAKFDRSRICVLPKTVTDLKPIAGILTLDSGSPLSHVQLLARNLGIPNGVVASELLPLLRQYQGQEIFYAISPKGVVILKEKSKLTKAELSLIQDKARSAEVRIKINLDKLNLKEKRILPVSAISLKDSGAIVGPKAANVAELYRRFPDKVAPGLVLPFGIFLEHLTQKGPGENLSPYEKMVDAYQKAKQLEKSGKPTDEINSYLLSQLSEFRNSILNLQWIPAFKPELKSKMDETFGPEGSYGIFVRSDTNVEDLPGFTGAGLNLTVPNQIGFDAVLNSISKVWASPFSERSFAWRQNFLDRPEHVYPSVLLMQSVPSDKSGVLVTRNIDSGDPNEISVSVHEGVGGVVEGEAAESLLIRADGSVKFIAQSKAPTRRRLRMQPPGGTETIPVSGEEAVLTASEIVQLRNLVAIVRRQYPNTKDPKSSAETTWDIEFGFVKGKLALFQIRPLVEDQRTMSLGYLRNLDREMKR